MPRHPVIQSLRQWGIAAIRTGIEHSPWRDRILFRLPACVNKRIALTFDDGPDPDFTPAILDLLAQYHWHATFFLVGLRAEAHPNLVQRILHEGHTVGNHTYSHVNPSTLSLSALHQELQRTDEVFRAAWPEYTSCWFRPPWGRLTRAQRIQALHEGRCIVYWSFTTHDYTANPEAILAAATQVKARDIFLLHDRNIGTRTALPSLLAQLKDAGFRCVSLDEAWDSCTITPRAGQG